MDWLVSDRACPAMTLGLACEALGAKAALLALPAALGAADEAALPEADCEAAAAFCGSLRWAFMLDTDWAMDEVEAAAAIGVSKMLFRISLLIS